MRSLGAFDGMAAFEGIGGIGGIAAVDGVGAFGGMMGRSDEGTATA